MTIHEIDALLRDQFPRAHAFATIVSVTPEELIARVPFRDEFVRPGGTISGPTMMTAADTTPFFHLLAVYGPVTHAVTSQLSIHFLHKPAPVDLYARTRFLRRSKRQAVCGVELRCDGADTLVAHATVTYALPRQPSE